MKIGVVTFPGSNCDEDMMYALGTIMAKDVVRLWHKDTDVQGCDLVVVPGGFSYGDYLRSGAIARFSPIMNAVTDHANKGGMVLGICNGFQVLCEAGLLPGALLHNLNQKFICRNTFIKPANNGSAINEKLEADAVLNIPIAHGEGRYYAPEDVISELENNQQVIFRYCGPNGEFGNAYNPNGSINNIAGVTNKTKNVFGMMPHPERASDKHLGNTDGLHIFESLLNLVNA